MVLSYIIPMYNSEKTIQNCIESITGQMQKSDEIIVIDNGSTDQSIDLVSKYPRVRVLTYPKVSIGVLRNFGAATAKGDLLAFIDSDCAIGENWRLAVEDTFADPNISATGSRVGIPEKSVWIERAWYLQKKSSTLQVRYINSGNFVVRKRVFDEVGGFSEELVTGEDSELGWRITKAGYSIVENPKVGAVHFGNPVKLKKFYEKEKWHALGMMGTVKISLYNKPLIMTVLFLVCNILALLNILLLAVNGFTVGSVFLSLVLTLCVPIVTAVYRALQYCNAKYVIHLTCLYWIYFLARANVLILIVRNSLMSRAQVLFPFF